MIIGYKILPDIFYWIKIVFYKPTKKKQTLIIYLFLFFEDFIW